MKQPYPQASTFSATSASTTENTGLNRVSPMDPSSPEQRWEIFRLFFEGHDIPRLAKRFSVGHKFIQSAIRTQYRAELALVSSALFAGRKRA